MGGCEHQSHAGEKLRVMRAEVMGLSVDYDDDDERRRTHPLLMPKVESERISVSNGEVLKKAAIAVPARAPAQDPKKGKLKGVAKKLIAPRAKQTAKRRSVLEVNKYGPDKSAKWKRVKARFPALYKALLANRTRIHV